MIANSYNEFVEYEWEDAIMEKIDYALYTEESRDNDRADWFESRDEAIEAARDAILNDGVDPDVVGIMAWEHNGDALWDFEIKFDSQGRCWCDDLSALDTIF